MVTLDFYQKLARQLELYLIQKANFVLPVAGYDLIVLLPVNAYSYDEKRTLLVSAASLDNVPLKTGLLGVLTKLRDGLSFEEYSSIFNVDIIESSAQVVQQLNASRLNPQFTDGDFEAPIQRIGGVTNQMITVIRSTVLNRLVPGEALSINLIDGSTMHGVIKHIKPLRDDAEVFVQTSDGLSSCLFTNLKELYHPARATAFIAAPAGNGAS